MQDISDRLTLDQYQALLTFRAVTNLSDADSYAYISNLARLSGLTFEQSAQVLWERVAMHWNGTQEHLEALCKL